MQLNKILFPETFDDAPLEIIGREIHPRSIKGQQKHCENSSQAINLWLGGAKEVVTKLLISLLPTLLWLETCRPLEKKKK